MLGVSVEYSHSMNSKAWLWVSAAALSIVAILSLSPKTWLPKEEFKPIVLCKKMAEQGDVAACYQLGTSYRFGNDINKDAEKAVYWLSKAADAGLPRAQSDLGLFYLYGEGVARDQAKAASLFLQAALKDDALGQFNIGSCYAHGEGAPKDYAEAAKWWSKAAQQGDATALLELGDLYSTGKGVAKDEVEAYSLYNIAGITIDEARLKLTKLEKNLSREEVAAGQKRTKELQKEIETKIAAKKAGK